MTIRKLILAFLVLYASPLLADILPPRAVQKPKLLSTHGITRVDPYYWLKEKDNKDVIKHLEAENTYTDAIMGRKRVLLDTLFREFKGRYANVDEGAPYLFQGFEYYSRQLETQGYPVYFRKNLAAGSKEELVLDPNELAKGQATFILGAIIPSPDDRYIAYSVDHEGGLIYSLTVIDRVSKKIVVNLKHSTGEFEWANDSKTLIYTTPDKAIRYNKVFRHTIGEKSKLIYEEKDDTFYVYLQKSRNGQSLVIQSKSNSSDELRLMDLNNLDKKPLLFQKRMKDVHYDIEDGGDRFFIHSDYRAKNYQIFECPKGKTELANWKVIIPHDSNIYRGEIAAFQDHLVVEERDGIDLKIRVWDRKSQSSRFVTFNDQDFGASLFRNYDYAAKDFRYKYQSLVIPPTIYAYNFSTGGQTQIHQRKVPGFNPSDYVTERLMAKSRDGVMIPMSIMYKKGLKKDGKNPVWIEGYGAYGVPSDPYFRSNQFSLLDRGFISAIAHVRGGSIYGKKWYEDGKLLKKKNTFTDFIDATEFLIEQKYADPARIFAYGRSAGGLLMGAISNMRPDLYKGILPEVPWVDVLTDMEDSSLPLVTNEYEEWGNPKDKAYYDYIKSYSPYDNVERKAYPAMFIASSFNDTQVLYWEPAKWAQRLRDNTSSKNLILLRMNMKAGHAGASSRDEELKELAEYYAFVISLSDGTFP